MPGSLNPDRVFQNLDQLAMRFGPHFILGLSGGGDSMALCVLAAKWAKTSQANVHAVCIDHGLREGSKADALQASHWAICLGLSAEIVHLNAAWPEARIQETARQRRHLALNTAAKQQNARVVLLGHNKDDQTETIAFRLARKTGLDGLAGIAALAPSPFSLPNWPSLVARPLLEVSRIELRTFLQTQGQSWLEDPANQNQAFSRIKTRKRLSQLNRSAQLLRIGSAARSLREISCDLGRNLLRTCLIADAAGQLLLHFETWSAAPVCLRTRTLGWLIAAINQTARLPEDAKTERLCAVLTAPHFAGATLGGVQISRDKGMLKLRVAKARQGSISKESGSSASVLQILAAISGDLEGFVTQLG